MNTGKVCPFLLVSHLVVGISLIRKAVDWTLYRAGILLNLVPGRRKGRRLEWEKGLIKAISNSKSEPKNERDSTKALIYREIPCRASSRFFP